MGGRHAATTQEFYGEECGAASRRPPLRLGAWVSLFAVPRQFSQQPSCHLAVVPLSSFSLLPRRPLRSLCLIALLWLYLTHRSPRPRSATARRRLPSPSCGEKFVFFRSAGLVPAKKAGDFRPLMLMFGGIILFSSLITPQKRLPGRRAARAASPVLSLSVGDEFPLLEFAH